LRRNTGPEQGTIQIWDKKAQGKKVDIPGVKNAPKRNHKKEKAETGPSL
jgi:hypothetical protein